jgi:hypothetical protein
LPNTQATPASFVVLLLLLLLLFLLSLSAFNKYRPLISNMLRTAGVLDLEFSA